MTYATVCSGIEAPSVAWHPLGCKPVFFSEISKFPCQVLAHHYPHVPNLGDMQKINGYEYTNTVDVLAGGTPCQSFSIAGLRQGMADPRGNLALVFLRLADQIRPRWIVWENVPGVLSSNKGRDFGSFLAALAKLGYGFAWRVLDAQHFGVAQERRRVFVVGHLGNWQPAAAVLSYGQGLRGNSPARKKTQEEIAPTITKSFGRRGFRDNGDVNPGLIVMSTQQASATIRYNLCPTISCNHDKPVITWPATVAPTISASNSSQFCDPQHIHSQNAGCLVPSGNKIRRITPLECERLFGFPDNYTRISEKTADTPRYDALGNSMAVPVVRWIGERINIIHKHLYPCQ